MHRPNPPGAPEGAPPSDPEQVIRALVDVARRARLDLQAWMQNYGHDLDTASLIADLGTAIRKAGIK